LGKCKLYSRPHRKKANSNNAVAFFILPFAVQNRMFIGKVSVFMELLLPYAGKLNTFVAALLNKGYKLPHCRVF
jgi:hypothetical protein